GVVNAHLINGDYDEAKKEAKYFKDLFGDDFYIELQNHSLIDDQIILRDAPRIAQELDIKVVATNDIHYLKKEHAIAHNVHLLIRDSTSANSGTIDIQKLKYRTPEMYFKTAKQMSELFKDTPEALTNTVEIADKCNMEIDTTLQMPVFPIPPESKSETLAEYLEELTNIGLKERYGELTPEIEERAKYELKVINDMGFPGYFLIVEDFIRAAVELGVRVGPGRGSAAGSLVAFALKITNVDPLEYDLLFERFLNPERVNMPDIDIDFADDKRDLVIQYVKQKYGEEAVSMIITFGKLSTKAVLKDVGRVLGIPHGDINAINRDIPSVGGKVTPLKKAIELPELSDLKNSHDPKIRELIDYSLILEGKYRNCSTHACGVVIAPGPISDFVPLYKSAKTKDAGVDVVSQYNMANIEDAGLLKMDFLGLRTLSIIENTLTMIEENYGKKIDIDNPEDL
ncbi:MAG: DNA polymerase III subunit alpha, partial [Chlorobi bacterium]|nr:DNA polymerase III subunit alpha [Chlorobiota bacterium]